MSLADKYDFDPNNVGVYNGNLFGFPYAIEDCKVVILPIPFDVTASYGKGTSSAPEAILNASVQLDFVDPYLEDAWTYGVGMLAVDQEIKNQNEKLSIKSKKYIDRLEQGEELNKDDLSDLNEVNKYCVELNDKDEVENGCPRILISPGMATQLSKAPKRKISRWFVLDALINIVGFISFITGFLLYLFEYPQWIYGYGIAILLLFGFSSLEFGLAKRIPKNTLLGILPYIIFLLDVLLFLMIVIGFYSLIGLFAFTILGCITNILALYNNYQWQRKKWIWV